MQTCSRYKRDADRYTAAETAAGAGGPQGAPVLPRVRREAACRGWTYAACRQRPVLKMRKECLSLKMGCGARYSLTALISFSRTCTATPQPSAVMPRGCRTSAHVCVISPRHALFFCLMREHMHGETLRRRCQKRVAPRGGRVSHTSAASARAGPDRAWRMRVSVCSARGAPPSRGWQS